MRRWTALHCVFAKLGPRRGDFRANAPNIPCFGALIVESGAYLAGRDPSRVGCGVGLLRIAYSRNWALDSAISRRRHEDSPLLTCSPWRVMCHWCVETGAEWDAAVDCPALRIREIGSSTRRFPCQRAEYSLFWRAHRRKRRIPVA